jgi:DNA polymerase-3 subunit alpha (Gram-positive type)
MGQYTNLISDSILVNETIELLQNQGGIATVVEVADSVLRIPALETDLAAALISDLIRTDTRLVMREDATVELVWPNFEKRKLSETDFVVFDLETTGAKVPSSRITEIGAYRIQKGQIVDKFETLINPETPIPAFISSLTNITDRMVKNAPVFSEVMWDFLEFIGDAVLVAHNAHFDMRFLNYEISRIFPNSQVFNPHLCTVKLSRSLLPMLENHRLHTVAQHFSIPIYNRHRAAGDAFATAHVFIRLLKQLQEQGVHDLDTARRFKH